ncbi:DUF4126 domain-containing protein [Acinetobacter sp. NIPH 1852]|uniref:DUF4126 domain-containing protein n=1 Tax=Acinetobacter sp. NIPH 1852 TaxID=2923428 RepID=UPI001F4ADCB3|nr:DUF4126 domain-containing protein [Acinetobacter sp. NIPH 1852]MCH7308950.1 DUF4126 domain-containing protein [Acinetobacter sp. NIPH 1852]
METILGLCIGVGLSAACGFRVFVPLLVMSIATLMGWYEPAKGFEWLAIPAVCVALGFATICEVAAYYVPWVDNLLDTVATPAAVIAGTLTTMAVISGEMSQFANWAAAIMVGGGTAGVVQMSTVAARGISTATTGGLGNFMVATGELIGSILLSVLAFVMPVAITVLVIVFVVVTVRWVRANKLENISPSL